MMKSSDGEAFKAVPTFLLCPFCSVFHIPVMVDDSILIILHYYYEKERLKI